MFDFDAAYNEWNGLGQDVEVDPHRCLTKKCGQNESYGLLLPVPLVGQIKNQVINPDTGSTYRHNSLLTMELLFFGIPGLEQYFVADTERTDNFMKFIGDSQKVIFARDVIPAIDPQHFEVFRPLFEFVITKCGAEAAVT